MTPKAPDYGHRYADKKLAALIRRLHLSYRQARISLQEKIGAYMAQFEKEDAKQRALYDSGELSHEDYLAWRYRKIAGTRQWRNMLEQLTTDMVNQDKIAASMINDTLPEVYAENHNYGTYEIEHDTQMSTSYTLYNRDAVARLTKDECSLLPVNPDIPKDERWNRQHIQSSVLQGILTGEPMQKIADRFGNLVGMDERAAMRNARTAVTGAENAGKLDSMRRAQGLGVRLKKLWLATRDQRTRDSHAMMDGEMQEVDEPFSNGCMYPGDPEGAASEIYNCRCAMRSKVAGADPYSPDLSRNERLGRMSYDEWKRQAGERFYNRLFRKEVSPGNNPNQTEQEPWDRSKVEYSIGGKSLQRRFDRAKVEYNEVKLLEKQLTEEEIINRIGGYDTTSGSCFSLACAYIGNKHGLDVIDYRGGDSMEIFREGFMNVTHLKGVAGKHFHKSGTDQLLKYLGMMEEGKEYMLTGGQHTTIVRLKNGIPEYLALQGKNNGWFAFERDVYYLQGKVKRHLSLNESVADVYCSRGKDLVKECSLIDIDEFKNSDEFRDLLGYINTKEAEQKKL